MFRRAIFLAAAVLGSSWAAAASESLEVLPASRHSQFLSYGLFHEEQTSLLLRDAGDLWAAFGGSIALLEMKSWWGAPQLVFSGGITSAFRKRSDTFDLSAHTFDGRFALALEFSPANQWRLSVGIAHVSGHLADGVHDPALAAPNLGEEHLFLRVVRDVGGSFRLGATLRPVLRSEPGLTAVSADQFVEWFPFGGRDNVAGTPYVAVGAEESGVGSWTLSWHVQAGVYFGSHLAPNKVPTVRLNAGYYHGADPRLKYARLRGERASFPYLGVALNL